MLNHYKLETQLRLALDGVKDAAERRAALEEVLKWAIAEEALPPEYYESTPTANEKNRMMLAAMRSGYLPLVRFVFSLGANHDARVNGSPLAYIAAEAGDCEMLQLFIDAGFANYRNGDDHLVLAAARSKSPAMLKMAMGVVPDRVFAKLPWGKLGESLFQDETHSLRSIPRPESAPLDLRAVFELLAERGLTMNSSWVADFAVAAYRSVQYGDPKQAWLVEGFHLLREKVGNDANFCWQLSGKGVLYWLLAADLVDEARDLLAAGLKKMDAVPSGGSWLAEALTDLDGAGEGSDLARAAIANAKRVGVELDARDNDGETAFTALIRRSCDAKGVRRYDDLLQSVRHLAAVGFNIDARMLDGYTPFQYALLREQEPLAALLKELGADVTRLFPDGRNALHVLASRSMMRYEHEGLVTLIEECAAAGVDPNAKDLIGRSPLHCVSDAALVAPLVRSGADINKHCDNAGWTPVQYYARRHASLVLTQAAINHGADVFIKDKAGVSLRDQVAEAALSRPVQTAVAAEVIAKTGEFMHALDGHGCMPVHAAVVLGNLWALKRIISVMPDIDIKASDGRSALHTAVIHSRPEIVTALLDKGADPNLLSDEGATALHMALDREFGSLRSEGVDLTILRSLVEAGADATLKYKNKAVGSMRRDSDVSNILRLAKAHAAQSEIADTLNLDDLFGENDPPPAPVASRSRSMSL